MLCHITCDSWINVRRKPHFSFLSYKKLNLLSSLTKLPKEKSFLHKEANFSITCLSMCARTKVYFKSLAKSMIMKPASKPASSGNSAENIPCSSSSSELRNMLWCCIWTRVRTLTSHRFCNLPLPWLADLFLGSSQFTPFLHLTRARGHGTPPHCDSPGGSCTHTCASLCAHCDWNL